MLTICSKQQRVAGSEHTGRTDELRRRPALAWRQQVPEQGRSIGLAERAKLQQLVARVAAACEVFLAGKQLGASRAHHQQRACEVLQQVAQQRQRVVMGLVQVFEDEADRRAGRVGLQEMP